MTDKVIKNLPIKLKGYICTLKKSSTDITNKESMCQSSIKVINFDRIPNDYSRGRGWRGVPKSNDALYIDVKGKWYFIEFKNGTVYKDEIYRKLYDSLIMLLEWEIIPDFIRHNIEYILVYNQGKYEKIQKSSAREQNYDYFMELAQQEERMFEIDKFENYLFYETHTYTPDLFEKKFVQPKEEEEKSFK